MAVNENVSQYKGYPEPVKRETQLPAHGAGFQIAAILNRRRRKSRDAKVNTGDFALRFEFKLGTRGNGGFHELSRGGDHVHIRKARIKVLDEPVPFVS